MRASLSRDAIRRQAEREYEGGRTRQWKIAILTWQEDADGVVALGDVKYAPPRAKRDIIRATIEEIVPPGCVAIDGAPVAYYGLLVARHFRADTGERFTATMELAD